MNFVVVVLCLVTFPYLLIGMVLLKKTRTIYMLIYCGAIKIIKMYICKNGNHHKNMPNSNLLSSKKNIVMRAIIICFI